MKTGKNKKRLPEFGYRLLRPILSPLFKLYFNPKIYGKENIPSSGPIIIAGNHVHIMDQCLVIIATKRVIHYMAKKEYFDGNMAWFFKFTGTISVNRNKHDDEAKRKAIEVLESDGAIGIFPEGTRNRTDAILLPFKYGALSMAKKTGAYIVPFAITGKYKFRSKDLKIIFGCPYKIPEEETLEESKNVLEEKVINLFLSNSN